MNYFIYSTSLHCKRKYELNKLISLPMCGFIAQFVEHCTGIAEVTGSNPVEALIFFRLLLSNCLNWKIYCDGQSSLSVALLFKRTESALYVGESMFVTDAATGNVKLITELSGTTQFLKHLGLLDDSFRITCKETIAQHITPQQMVQKVNYISKQQFPKSKRTTI